MVGRGPRIEKRMVGRGPRIEKRMVGRGLRSEKRMVQFHVHNKQDHNNSTTEPAH